MKWTKTFIQTLRENPQDAEIDSHKLLVRAGICRKTASGLFTFMPLGIRVLRKIENIVREEMNAAGALEILMPALQPAELWQKTGRWDTMGANMFRLKDRAEHITDGRGKIGAHFALKNSKHELKSSLSSFFCRCIFCDFERW